MITMENKSGVRRSLAVCLMVLVMAISAKSYALTILSGPVFTPATNAPLAGLLQVTTDVKSRISVQVADGTNSWTRNFYDFSLTHSNILLGFKPDQTNLITVTAYDEQHNAYTDSQPLTFVTAPLPADFPHSTVLTSDPTNMEPGYLLLMVDNRNAKTNYIIMYDNSGSVVWYEPWKTQDVDVRQMDNGNLFIEEPQPISDFLQVNMLGKTVWTLNAPSGYPVNIHDGVPTDHGTILYFSGQSVTVTNFPSNDTDPNATRGPVTVGDQRIIEIDTNGTVLNHWSPTQLLIPNRITYLTYGEHSGDPYGVDSEHANAVLEDTNDNSIIVSLRNQNAIFDFTRQGQLKWILAPHANWTSSYGNLDQYLLTPVGTNFEWSYGQHAPELTPQGTLLVFDDGPYRASPYDTNIVSDQTNYSRGVEYSINETNMEVTQVWDSTPAVQDKIYAPVMGKTQWLPKTHNILVTYAFVAFDNEQHPSPYAPNATMVRIKEYTHTQVPKVVFDLSIFDYTNTSTSYLGYFTYRCEKVPDLYTHPAKPVCDLMVQKQNQSLLFKFTADPARNYVVQASNDLINWVPLGIASYSGNPGEGDFGFTDTLSNQIQSRFYRIVTQ